MLKNYCRNCKKKEKTTTKFDKGGGFGKISCGKCGRIVGFIVTETMWIGKNK